MPQKHSPIYPGARNSQPPVRCAFGPYMRQIGRLACPPSYYSIAEIYKFESSILRKVEENESRIAYG
jgi:hypothetical protein